MRTTPKPIDLARVRRGLASLDRLAADHPELVDIRPGSPGASTVAGWERTLMEAGVSEVETKQVAFRLPVDLIERIDAYAERATRLAGGLATVTRSDVVRVVLARSMDVLEAEIAADEKAP